MTALVREGGVVGVDVAALYAEHRLALVRMAVLLVDSTPAAEDVVHDAFLALHRKQSAIRDPQAALGYLRRSVLNGARDALRRRRTVRAHLRAAEPDIGGAADEATLLAEEHAIVVAAVRQLPTRDQEVLLLRYWSELSEAEIADTLGVSRGTVKSTASRALDKLHKALEASR
jgi:RNA polymerase sigma-70 factor (sigma-E family)